jgi:membrane-bound metal-dependent hydrolase YbcI (DUF457 family)
VPLPLGHMAIGFAAHEISRKGSTNHCWWKITIFIGILANLPDVDVLVGLVFRGNGWAFHRGPTHSLVFALLMACLASRVWKLWPQVPKIGFISCFLVIFSHVMADSFLGSSAVSLLWPFEINWSAGHIGWGGVVSSVVLHSLNETDIILASGLVAILIRFLKSRAEHFRSGQRVLSRLNGNFPQ